MTWSAITFRSLLLSFMLFPSVAGTYRINFEGWYDFYNLIKSACSFHASILYNKIRFGSAFSFNPVMGGCDEANAQDNKPCVCLSEGGKIISMHDGKKIQLLLSAIPRYKEHFDEIKKYACLSEADKIGLYTLNRDFERNWAGLSELEKTEPIIRHQYPTTDHTAPRFVDIIRAVRDLENRDQGEEKVAIVHCKAGRGRSATVVCAYLMHVCNKAGLSATAQQVEEYLKARRSRVSINNAQRKILEQFADELKQAGNFNALYKKYTAEVQKRDQELTKF